MANKLSIGRLELQSDGRWAAHMQNGDGGWFVANTEAIPSSKLDDGEYHLFRYNDEDQFATYVDLHKLQGDARDALSGDPDQAGDFLRSLAA